MLCIHGIHLTCTALYFSSFFFWSLQLPLNNQSVDCEECKEVRSTDRIRACSLIEKRVPECSRAHPYIREYEDHNSKYYRSLQLLLPEEKRGEKDTRTTIWGYGSGKSNQGISFRGLFGGDVLRRWCTICLCDLTYGLQLCSSCTPTNAQRNNFLQGKRFYCSHLVWNVTLTTANLR